MFATDERFHVINHDGMEDLIKVFSRYLDGSVAKALGVTVVAVCKWLDDRHCITLQTAQKLARALDVPMGMIVKKEV